MCCISYRFNRRRIFMRSIENNLKFCSERIHAFWDECKYGIHYESVEKNIKTLKVLMLQEILVVIHSFINKKNPENSMNFLGFFLNLIELLLLFKSSNSFYQTINLCLLSHNCFLLCFCCFN